MAHVSHKLSNSFEGALAGGGDPATSPLYVFGPFLKLVVVAGVAQITFGASVWLVVFTIATVSAMYRLVMTWVIDGSGGSGLSEEEFGGWAVKVNASITFVEYTLTFLVSMAAMVTFIADRFPVLNHAVLGIQYRTVVAIVLSLFTGWLVNRGPRVAARAFGPATFGVLLLLWAMVAATIWKQGLHLPSIDLRAFTPEFLHFTFGGYAHILAVMTGIEVFANLVAAYGGDPAQRSRKAFGSLLIIMGTTSVTMLVVGPAILNLSNPANEQVSVFTQTMDQLLPDPIPYLGTLVGIAVLLSASAASAQGLQNLALGLADRHYVPAFIGQRNRFDVADKPVWIEVGLVSLCFMLFGTNEETYLAIYAAGVFVLLSMTGWAASKRLIRELKSELSASPLAALVGSIFAALFTSVATVIIFGERFFEGAWTYFVFIPVLYATFSYFRARRGRPSLVKEQLGEIEQAMLGGFGIGQGRLVAPFVSRVASSISTRLQPIPSLTRARGWRSRPVEFRRLLVPLDGSVSAEQALLMAQAICHTCRASLTLVSVMQPQGWSRVLPSSQAQQSAELDELDLAERQTYLSQLAERTDIDHTPIDYAIGFGSEANEIRRMAREAEADFIVMSTHGRSGVSGWLIGSVANKVVQLTSRPVLLVRPTATQDGRAFQLKKLLVALDGSEFAERVLPYAKELARCFGSEILLLSVPEVPETSKYGAMADAVETLRQQAEDKVHSYLEGVAAALRAERLNVRVMVTGSGPARTIVALSEAEGVDLIMLTTHGLGAIDRLLMGSVADRVVKHARLPVFLVPIHEQRPLEAEEEPEYEMIHEKAA